MSYYAVRRGRNPGVYNSWSDCRDEVDGYSGARYKKFGSSAEAEAFVDGYDQSSYQGSSRGSRGVDVYTDGACFNNGRDGARAGIGVYWGPGHPSNVSERLPGRQTNNRAEIKAAETAIGQARDMGYNEVNVHTDSKFLTDSVNNWMPGWKRNDWKTSTGSDVVNRRDFESLERASEGMKVNYVSIYSKLQITAFQTFCIKS